MSDTITFTVPCDADLAVDYIASLFGYCVDVGVTDNPAVLCGVLCGYADDDKELLTVDLWDDAKGQPSGTTVTVELHNIVSLRLY